MHQIIATVTGYVDSSSVAYNLIENTSYSAMTIGCEGCQQVGLCCRCSRTLFFLLLLLASVPATSSCCLHPLFDILQTPGGWGRTGCGRGNNSVVANRIINSNRARCCDGGQVGTAADEFSTCTGHHQPNPAMINGSGVHPWSST